MLCPFIPELLNSAHILYSDIYIYIFYKYNLRTPSLPTVTLIFRRQKTTWIVWVQALLREGPRSELRRNDETYLPEV